MAGDEDIDLYLATCAQLPKGDSDTERLARDLDARGVQVRVAPWDDPDVAWSRARLTLIRSTWDYHRRRDDFVRWAHRVRRLRNEASLVEWNTDKRYLLDLPDAVPVVPTRILTNPTDVAVQGALDELGWIRAVLKPAVGLDGHGVRQVTRDTVDGHRHDGTWLLQPFVEEAATEGETSVILIEGSATHAVRRFPPAGDFRAQERLGGRVEACELTPELVEIARAAVTWLEPRPLYARVDLVRRAGALTVMELELVEPSLFFGYGAGALAGLTDAVTRLLGATGPRD